MKTTNSYAFQKIDRKAWIRILEVFLAILLMLGAILIIMNRRPVESDISDEVYEKQRQILEIISKNDSLRGKIIIGENTEVNDAISQMLPQSWNFSTNICEINNVCNNPQGSEVFEKDVYSTEVLVTSTLTDYSPKKLRFFVWVK